MAGIEKILILSIIHISKKTSEAIAMNGGIGGAMNGGIGGLPAYPYERGHFMYIGDIEVRKIGDGKNREIVLLKSGQRLCDVPPELIDCVCAAVKRECQWILFDRYAEIERSLDTFIW